MWQLAAAGQLLSSADSISLEHLLRAAAAHRRATKLCSTRGRRRGPGGASGCLGGATHSSWLLVGRERPGGFAVPFIAARKARYAGRQGCLGGGHTNPTATPSGRVHRPRCGADYAGSRRSLLHNAQGCHRTRWAGLSAGSRHRHCRAGAPDSSRWCRAADLPWVSCLAGTRGWWALGAAGTLVHRRCTPVAADRPGDAGGAHLFPPKSIQAT